MFDASLAAAWTIGRLVALQDQSFATSLYGWKRGQAQAVVDTVERQIIDDAFAGLIAAPAPTPEPAAQEPQAGGSGTGGRNRQPAATTPPPLNRRPRRRWRARLPQPCCTTRCG